MLNRSAEITTYPGSMDRVQLNLPDELRRQIDRAAERAGESREEFLRRIADEKATESEAAFRKEMEDLLGPPMPMGGEAAEIIREMRDNRPPPSHHPRDDA
jgi:hypothetical protein